MRAKKILTNLAVFLFSGFIIIYIIIQLISSLSADVSFQHALNQTVEDTLEKNCVLVRNETVLYTTQTGITTYSVAESQKIGKGQLIATVFSSEQGVDLQNQIQKIDEKIRILERSAVDTSYLTSDVSKIDQKIYQLLTKTRLSVLENKIGLSKQFTQELLINFNKRQIITTGVESFETAIQNLRNQKNTITSNLHNPLCTVYADSSGYFSTLLDGYESIYTADAIENLSIDSYHDMIAKNASQPADNAIGKIITDFEWRALCEVTKKEAENLTVGKSYPVSFLYSSGQQLNAVLERKVTQTNQETIVLVFRLEEIPQDFDFTRIQTIKIVRRTMEGLSVPVSAVRFIDGQTGVYIIDGNNVGFRKIDILYSENSNYYCREYSSDDPASEEYLSRYDRVITEGKNLYVGRLLD